MQKILALWATPRSTSTAFEWVMANRGDMTCLHEPYNEAYYYSEYRRNDRYFIADPALEAIPGLSFEAVHRKLLDLAGSGRVFIKDFACSVMHMADDGFLDRFTHTFLIRDPGKVIPSMHARWPDIALDELGFEDLHLLFRRVAEREGSVPPVIDSDDLLQAPEQGIRTYCEAAGIPHIGESVRWGENVRDRNPTWNSDEHGFHDSLKSSRGLGRQRTSYPPLDSSADMLRLYRASMPHYEKLFEHRLRFGS